MTFYNLKYNIIKKTGDSLFKKIVLWILVISCMSVIFFFSSQTAKDSRKVSSGFITAVIKFFDFNDALTAIQINNIKKQCTFIVRKGAHFSLYGLLGLLLYMLLTEYGLSGVRNSCLAVFISFLYACTDELHQNFVIGRSCEVRDIIIDSVGALTGCMIIAALRRILRRKQNELHRKI